MTAPAPSTSTRTLVSAADVQQELARLFGGMADRDLVVSVYGDEDAEGTVSTFHELMRSFEMHGGENGRSAFQDAMVQAPNAVTIERALLTLGQADLQRRLLDQVLTTFGHHLIDPLGAVLDAGPDGTLMSELTAVRERVIADLAALQVTSETRSIVIQDISKLLTNDYLAMLAEHEERELRPRVRELAQEILRLIGDIFHKALGRWPEHAKSIAHAVRRRLSGEVRLTDLPHLLRQQVLDGIEEFLWVETSNDIEGALRAMFASRRNIADKPPRLERSAYKTFAVGCWKLMTEHA
ncbi:MAG: hypothetical protein R3B40_22095 [Polyangiales bacterium]|nr:hypothetical protein [Myxococcales bacterium]MCB9656851.1 hypothetical protein [Sandaracinaceae bacterium]